jgi:TetR/AcrR family transcriptional regulator
MEMATKDRHELQSSITRERLLEAALAEFSRNGFEGASTRIIAAQAGCHQPQINYHFESKESLWEAMMLRLFTELETEMDGIQEIADPVLCFETMLRRFIRFAARRPELNRIMVAEAMEETSRLKWIVETYSRSAHERTLDMWRAVRAAGAGAEMDERLVYHAVIGAASLLWANGPEANLLDSTFTANREQLLELHAEAVVALFLPKTPKRKSSEPKTQLASTKSTTRKMAKR